MYFIRQRLLFFIINLVHLVGKTSYTIFQFPTQSFEANETQKNKYFTKKSFAFKDDEGIRSKTSQKDPKPPDKIIYNTIFLEIFGVRGETVTN